MIFSEIYSKEDWLLADKSDTREWSDCGEAFVDFNWI